MKIAKKPKLYAKDFLLYAVVLSLFFFFFINLLYEINFTGTIYFILVLLFLLLYIFLRRSLPKIKINLFWAAVLIIIFISNGSEIRDGKYYWVSLYFVLTLLMFFLSANYNWLDRLKNIVFVMGSIHVFATIFFFFLPFVYGLTMAKIWGVIPYGLTLGSAYKAGITDHYSTNGSYCSVMVLLLGSNLLVKRNQKIKLSEKVLLFLSIFALILTTKRGHIVFSLLALIVVYYVCNPKDKISKIFYIAVAVLVALILIFSLAPFLPVLGAVLDRFIGADDISSGRFVFWAQAIEAFKEDIWRGIGWGQYVKINIFGTGVHNIYLQLLCETGLPGFAVFTVAMITTWRLAINDYRKYSMILTEEQRKTLAFSIAGQTFIIAYGLTGNCLYDMNVIFYYIVCAVTLSFHHMIRAESLRRNN